MRHTYKQEVIGSRGVVSANHPLASLAGVEMLASGGNAVDAAVAAIFTLTVVEPMMVGITGAGFVNLYNAEDNKSVTIDNYSTAPLASTPDMYKPISDSWPDYMETKDQANKIGYLSVGVPAALQSWCHIEDKYGKLGIDRVIQPAIRHAEQGFQISPYLASIIASNRESLGRFTGSRNLLFSNNAPISHGFNLINSDYAHTLRMIAKSGDETLRSGSLGAAIARDMVSGGGILTQDDLESYQISYREPVRGTYRGYEIVGVGPVSSGATHIIQALNILEGFEVGNLGFGSSEYIHLIAETLKIVFADRFQFMADPGFVSVPVEGLISREYAEFCRARIDPGIAGRYAHGDPSSFVGESENTTHLTVADENGNVVSMTQTLNDAFGSRVTVPGTGVILNNTMYNFDPHPGTANSIAPGKRVLSSMAPIIVFKDGRPYMALGTPGGRRIFGSVLQGILNVIDHGMSLQEAVEAPRIWTQGQNLELEPGIDGKVEEVLSRFGHELERV
ncbi:uncharacterized protein METZ01_LOCUS77591, partial [marine metagenome]